MSEETADTVTGTQAAESTRRKYQPPVLTPLGNVRDMLAADNGPSFDDLSPDGTQN